MRQDDEIEDLFRSAFADFEVTPPPSVKEAIDREIGLTDSKKRRGAWWWTFSFIGFLFVAFACFFIYRSTFHTGAQFVAESGSKKTTRNSQNHPSADTTVAGRDERKAGKHAASGNTNLDEQLSNSNKQHGQLKRTTTAEKANQAGNNQNHLQKTGKQSVQSKSGKTVQSRSGKAKSQAHTVEALKKGSWRFGKGKSRPNKAGKSEGPNGKPVIITTSPATGGGKETDNPTPASALATTGKQDPEKPIMSPEKGDSAIAAIDTVPQANPVQPPAPEKGNTGSNNTNWLLSLRGGPTLWPGGSKDGVQKANGWAVQTGISRNFWGNYGLSTGLELESWKESLKKIETTTTKTFLFTVDVPIYDPQNPDSIIGYDLDSIYSTHTKQKIMANKNEVISVNIPLYFRYSKPIAGNFILDINAGVVLAYQKTSNKSDSDTLSNSIPQEGVDVEKGSFPQEIQTFGMKLVLQPQLRYQFNHFGVSVFTNLGYDLLPAVRYEGYKPLQLFGTVGVGLHWQF